MLKRSPPDTGGTLGSDTDLLKPGLCILGGGPAGLALAITAAACGEQVVLVEKHRLGGASLAYGTVPYAALQAAAEAATAFRTSAVHGIVPMAPAVDWAKVSAGARDAIAALEPSFTAERLSGLGVRVVPSAGRFVGPRTLVAGSHRIEARRFVVATGSTPLVPDISGVGDVPALTTDTIFDVREPIDHLVVIGGGAAGCQFAQAYRRLGARVTLIEQGHILSRFDSDLAAVVGDALRAEGVTIHQSARVEALVGARRRVEVRGIVDGAPARIECSYVLIACGRRPVVTDIGLDAARVTVLPDGIKVDRRLRSSNRRIYAIGDVTGHPHSHARAEYHARQFVTSIILGQRAPIDPRAVPVAVLTDPGIAQVGLTEEEARKVHGRIEVHRFPMRDNVRAVAVRRSEGHIKVIADRSGRILGAGIACRSAAELIDIWSLAVSNGMTLNDMGDWIAPHPTLGEVNRKVVMHRSMAIARFSAARAWGKLNARLG